MKSRLHSSPTLSRAALLGTLCLLVTACGKAAPPPAAPQKALTARRNPLPAATATPVEGDKPLSAIHDLLPGAECPDPGPSGTATIAAAAAALIPLKEGLTLSSIWKAFEGDYEHECLIQIAKMDARGFSATQSCPVGKKHEQLITTRRICWSDVIDSHIYITGVARKFPPTFVGALQFNLSLASFAVLKAGGELHHRYVVVDGDDPRFSQIDLDGHLTSDGAGTFNIIVNDKLVEVPTIEASYINHKTNDIIRIKALDEARFPLMLDFYVPSEHRFFVTYAKVSFPTANVLEQHLAVDKHTDVYGIYFNFASDVLRPESQPVLREIADALKAHADWKIIIHGHTDNIGGDAMNLDLSRRRAAAVRKDLVEHYQIDESRLSTSGFGASQPKEPNDSERGRARNRRVELIRQ